ncbi:hypothetical protein [Planktothrix paucivesiculata]|uniref:PatU n=1 Tax=Planktothrix paucivesiculata PCC 9631 TaxID=671071 RepID=A0A7Z9BM68_9CYAN|nr:hypothetical protein [Planktothrix paucivesiculata]VXD17353.1 conserved hypothetical protein [Planktothrix paucivesiculata PCC 9631]
MNNETNQEEQAFERQFLDWLLQQHLYGENYTPTGVEAEAGLTPHIQLDGNSHGENLEGDELDPLDSEDEVFHARSQCSPIGEIGIVKNRFESVLREKLKARIQLNPPLFPWEPIGTDLLNEYPDVFREEQVPPTHLWMAHRQQLRWSMPLPDQVFAQLLAPVFTLLQSGLREGAKLVQAVETLFPNESQPLNELAGLVIRGSLRGSLDLRESQPRYETATPEQQMVLLLLATQELLNTLTLNCHLNQSTVHQEWLTSLGLFTVDVDYVETESGTILKIRGKLPDGGRLQLLGNDRSVTRKRNSPGCLPLELINPEPNQIYRLHVLLDSEDQNPLCFAICPQPRVGLEV